MLLFSLWYLWKEVIFVSISKDTLKVAQPTIFVYGRPQYFLILLFSLWYLWKEVIFVSISKNTLKVAQPAIFVYGRPQYFLLLLFSLWYLWKEVIVVSIWFHEQLQRFNWSLFWAFGNIAVVSDALGMLSSV